MKIIVFEGIDGSGKSSTLGEAAKLLGKDYTVKVIQKKSIVNNPDEYGITEKKFFRELNDMCWNFAKDDHFDSIPINTWIYLHACWYNFIFKKLRAMRYDLLLVDGWFYKIFARMMITSKESADFVYKIVSTLNAPDFIIHLQINPEIAWERKEGRFGECELGMLNDYDNYVKNINSPFKQFVRFQNLVNNNITSLIKEISHVEIDVNTKDIVQVAVDASSDIKKFLNFFQG